MAPSRRSFFHVCRRFRKSVARSSASARTAPFSFNACPPDGTSSSRRSSRSWTIASPGSGTSTVRPAYAFASATATRSSVAPAWKSASTGPPRPNLRLSPREAEGAPRRPLHAVRYGESPSLFTVLLLQVERRHGAVAERVGRLNPHVVAPVAPVLVHDRRTGGRDDG